jgi:antitoxin ParD1/3/4
MTKNPRSTEGFSTLDDFLGEEGTREAFQAVAVKEVEEAKKLNCLRKAWQEGLDSGDAGELDFKALKQEARARLAASKA